jgi:glutamyl-tRNA synthetase
MTGAVVGRLAPSPTGAQHLGNARTFLIAWLAARSCGGKLILRIEDIDSPRVKRWAIDQAIEDLKWLGLDWDEGPDCPGANQPYLQTERVRRYHEALQQLIAKEHVYPCTCSRSDIEEAASAPHAVGEGQNQVDGAIYAGTCSYRRASDAAALPMNSYAWRFRMRDTNLTWCDGLQGVQSILSTKELGDFVVAKKDGGPAYQLAVVVDDHDMGVNMVVRGDDLIPSTYRQLSLYESFDWQPPRFWHVPLVVGLDGRRLAKRHGDTRLSSYREAGVSAKDIVGWIAWSCGWCDHFSPKRPQDLLPSFDWKKIPDRRLIFPGGVFDFRLERPMFQGDL